MKAASDIEQYIQQAPEPAREKLQELNNLLQTIGPGEPCISYGMPAYRNQEVIVWFAGYQRHIGFYPKSKAIQALADALLAYKTSKGAIQFPLDKPLPVALIKKIVRFRLNEIKAKQAVKKK